MAGKFVLSDGRAFTDYRPNCLMNKESAKAMSPLEHRLYLQKNAVKIMEQNSGKAIKKNKNMCSCDKCIAASKRR